MTRAKPLISIVSPVYKAETIIEELVKRIETEVSLITENYEILLVEDCSPDNSWGVIRKICEKHPKVKGIKLSRNFGQHFAIAAGLDNSSGDYVVVMDCDLQDDPKYIAEMYNKAQEGYEIIYTYKETRNHSFFKNLYATAYHWTLTLLVDNSEWKLDKNIGSFSMMSRRVVDEYGRFNDYRRHHVLVLAWLGFSSCKIKIQHLSRFEGKSSYNFWKLVAHAIDGVTTQSTKLLRLNILLGLLISALSFVAVVMVIFLYFSVGFQSGWASLIVTVLFSTGILLTSIGITGLYIGKTFEQSKNRPKYLIDKKLF